MTLQPLEGYTIGVTADRRADEQMKLLAGRGADCIHGPVIKTHPVESGDELRVATESLLDAPPDIVVLTTGLGVRSWLEAADAEQLGDGLREVLEAAQLFVRGPKANGALVTAGFEVEWVAPRARYDDIVNILSDKGMRGIKVAVQLDGAGAADLCDRIESLGAEVTRVPVYRWSLPKDTVRAERLIRATADRRIDGLTFTAKPAVENFLELASFQGLLDDVVGAMAADVGVFCVGEVCATGFDSYPNIEPSVPERHRLGSMVLDITRHFAKMARSTELAGIPVKVQGRVVEIGDGESVGLTDRESALLGVLIERPGVVYSKRELLRSVWKDNESDEHLVEVTIARLRQRLGPAAQGIETVVRRGYRASVT